MATILTKYEIDVMRKARDVFHHKDYEFICNAIDALKGEDEGTLKFLQASIVRAILSDAKGAFNFTDGTDVTFYDWIVINGLKEYSTKNNLALMRGAWLDRIIETGRIA